MIKKYEIFKSFSDMENYEPAPLVDPHIQVCELFVKLYSYFEDFPKVHDFYESAVQTLINSGVIDRPSAPTYSPAFKPTEADNILKNFLDFGFISFDEIHIQPVNEKAGGYFYKYWNLIRDKKYNKMVELAKQDSIEYYVTELKKSLDFTGWKGAHSMYFIAFPKILEGHYQFTDGVFSKEFGKSGLNNTHTLQFVKKPSYKIFVESKNTKNISEEESKKISNDIRKYFIESQFDL